jgi:hypothetical protein
VREAAVTTIPCTQCGSINFLSAENCKQCGAELHYLVRAGAPSVRRGTAEASTEWEEEVDDFAPEIEPFTGVGSALNSTFSIFKDNFWLISKIVLALFVPLEVFKALTFTEQPNNWQAMAGAILMSLFCGVLVTPSVIYALVTKMRTGVAPKLGDVYLFGLSKIVKAILASIMVGFLVGLGFICLIIPGIILAVVFQLTYPILTLENLSASEAMSRSSRLTKGYRLNIFLTLLVTILVVAVVNIPVSIFGGILTAGGIPVVGTAVAALISDLLSEVTNVLALVLYIGILKDKRQHIPLSELPPPPPAFVES